MFFKVRALKEKIIDFLKLTSLYIQGVPKNMIHKYVLLYTWAQ